MSPTSIPIPPSPTRSETADQSTSSSLPPTPTRPASTFRRIPAKASTAPHTPSLLSPARAARSQRTVSSSSNLSVPSPLRAGVDSTQTSALPSPALSAPAVVQRPDPSLSNHARPVLSSAQSSLPNSRTASPTPSVYQSPRRPPAATPGASSSSRQQAPYRPGFQPKGVYRPRTDEFIAARTAARDVGRIEQQRLERRLDKLIDLHFSPAAAARPKPAGNRRASSFFELDITAAPADLLRGDALAPACRLCGASFHPITNRKHHCRLCGRIICALPPKAPQRVQTCSLLFVADPRSGKIEEVGEGVDYGVKKRGAPVDKKAKADEDKFLKGVRICRDCRPTLLRKQYAVEQSSLPTFARLYEAMIIVEKELEDSLPAFQEMLLALNNNPETQSTEAKAARKRLLDAFADYDTLSKRILGLPCAPASSQERVQTAIRTRANLFLQQHMFPLQALPRPTRKKPEAGANGNGNGAARDADSKLAMALQPLLEQEKLLESMVEEARARRKFEDARTIQANLEEIRGEIDRIIEAGQLPG
ncbi:hypothetical protein AURDEDRAFT_54312 [Auricularia subglabra TFB-10046 SS5]|nr:hypothetical protein AURDEDRAFT_54312 [Auricularia subglabra TFB-10046 SS5]